MTTSGPAEDTAVEQLATPAPVSVVPGWGACLVVALAAIVWAEMAGMRNLLFARETVSTWGWIRAGALYGAFALIVLAAWERAAPFLRAGRFWLVLAALVAVFYQPTWLTEDLPRRLGLRGGDVVREIAAPRTYRPLTAPVPYTATSAERFSIDSQPAAGERGDDGMASMFAWDVPAGWTRVSSRGRLGRLVSFALPGSEDAECYFSVMPGAGGSLDDNLNRWRGQFGQAPLSAAEIAALPSVTFLGANKPLLECEGTFTGAGDGTPRAGYKLLAVCLAAPQALITAKLVGPAAIVDAQRGGFERFCASVRLSDAAQDTVRERGGAGGETAGGTAGGTGLAWTAPAGWKRGEDRFGREVTFTAPSGAECWVTVLNGDGGGWSANVERWRGQMGLPRLPPGEAQQTGSLDVLGGPAELVDLEGEGTQAGQAMLVVMRPLAERTVFVKLTGAANDVAAARAEFEVFCRSLRME